MPDLRITKVTRFRILKPAGDMTWQELGALLRDTRYRVYRLANLAVSEAYLNFHLWRTNRADEFDKPTIGNLNRRLREMLIQEEAARSAKAKKAAPAVDHDRFSKTGALPDSVVSALSQYKVKALTSNSKWNEVIRGEAALPTFRRDGPIFVRSDDKPGDTRRRRLERTEAGEVELDLMICRKPFPRVVLATKEKGVGGSALAILNRLLENTDQSMDGYRQRCFEIKEDRNGKWWLYITYDFPASDPPALSADRVVGVDLGVAVPMYVAINNGHARMGWRQYAALAARIKSLQRQTMARRKQIQRGGRSNLSSATARFGHGRKRRLRPIEKLEGRIDDAYRTLNHQLSRSVVDFALHHGAGLIQIEDLSGLKDQLAGTWIGANWRYHELQNFIQYKAAENGIKVVKVNPFMTSRRCSQCGHIHAEFDRRARDEGRRDGMVARFSCPQCGFEADPDYNAARNLATLDIEELIAQQCRVQGVEPRSLTDRRDAATRQGSS